MGAGHGGRGQSKAPQCPQCHAGGRVRHRSVHSAIPIDIGSVESLVGLKLLDPLSQEIRVRVRVGVRVRVRDRVRVRVRVRLRVRRSLHV